jgi:hypothetical protein
MSFGIYSIGFMLVIGGLTYGAYLMHVPARWISWVQLYYWAWEF